MAYDWQKASEQMGGVPMPDGLHLAKVVKIRTGIQGKSGEMIAVTFRDKTGDVDTLCTLTDEASWTLARLLSRCGVDLKQMSADGVEPRNFSKQQIADQYLLDTEVWIKVSTTDASNPKNLDKNGNPYRRVNPLHKEEAEKADPAGVKAIEDSNVFDPNDIPF